MQVFRRKPFVVDAVQYDGSNAHAIGQWATGKELGSHSLPEGWWKRQVASGAGDEYQLVIATVDGEWSANPGDWVIKDHFYAVYPMQQEEFEANFDLHDHRPCETDVFLALLQEHVEFDDQAVAITDWVEGDWERALNVLPAKVRKNLLSSLSEGKDA